MAKYTFYASIGYEKEEVVEIPDEELNGLSEKELEKVIQGYYDNWLVNNAELAWWRTE